KRAGGVIGPGPRVDVEDTLVLGDQREVGVAAGDMSEAAAPRILDRPALDELAVPLPSLRDPPDPAGGAMRHVLLDVIEEAAGNLGQAGVGRRERVELIPVEDQELNPMVVVDVLVQDLDADDVADDVGRPIVVATDPDQAEIVAVRVAPNDLETGEVT